MDGSVEWRPTTLEPLQLVFDPDRPGGGLVPLQVGDLSAFDAAARERGIKGPVRQTGVVVTGLPPLSIRMEMASPSSRCEGNAVWPECSSALRYYR